MTKIIAYYLPQFHPIPENDKVWGEGFTEWDNVRAAQPLFNGHQQPRQPADLGYYDLRDNDIKAKQIQLARQAGIYGFCYWHYWFNGKQVLQTPFNQMLDNPQLDLPFCLCWANHSWKTTTWSKQAQDNDPYIIKQTYGGETDYRRHFEIVLKAFRDPRYIRIDDKPLFGIYDPYAFADVPRFIKLWRHWAKQEGLNGIHFYALANSTTTITRDFQGNISRTIPNLNDATDTYRNLLSLGFDAIQSIGMARGEMKAYGKTNIIIRKFISSHFPDLLVNRLDYSRVMNNLYVPQDKWENIYPAVIPNWDRSPRVGKKAVIYTDSTPENFYHHLRNAIEMIKNKQPEHQLLFLKSWNEWAEGNYVEPDTIYGHGYLDAIHRALQ